MTDPHPTTSIRLPFLGPDALDVPDTPDAVTDRDASPRPEDGPQDVTQDPNDIPAGA